MENSATKIAEYLLQIKAIKLQPSNPFTWASGLKSPIYCDNRKTLSFPDVRSYIRDSFAGVVSDYFPECRTHSRSRHRGYCTWGPCGGKTGTCRLFMSGRRLKEHGLGNQIEGYFEPGQKVVVIEDLISTGGSSLGAVKALRDCRV